MSEPSSFAATGLRCRLFYDSAHAAVGGAAAGGECVAIDLAGDAGAAEPLRRLGLRVPDDLPVALLAAADGRLKVVGARLTAGEVERLAAGHAWMPAETVVYAASWCGDCRRTKRQLQEAGVRYAEVDIEHDAAAEALVLARSGGRRVVPTLQLDGRLWAFNPEPPLLRRLLAP